MEVIDKIILIAVINQRCTNVLIKLDYFTIKKTIYCFERHTEKRNSKNTKVSPRLIKHLDLYLEAIFHRHKRWIFVKTSVLFLLNHLR